LKGNNNPGKIIIPREMGWRIWGQLQGEIGILKEKKKHCQLAKGLGIFGNERKKRNGKQAMGYGIEWVMSRWRALWKEGRGR
jgi:hypothetical protein